MVAFSIWEAHMPTVGEEIDVKHSLSSLDLDLQR